jgi:hypothetical protein
MKKGESTEFLLKEFDQADSERIRLRAEAIQRLNYFLTLTSAILGGLVFFGQSGQIQTVIYVLIAALVFLSVIGWQTFRYIIIRDINSDRMLRAQGRIRRYFVDNDPQIKDYLMWQTHDEPSGYITKNDSAIRRTSQTVMALLLSLLTSLLISLFNTQQTTLIPIGIILFVVLLFALEFYAQSQFREAVKSARKQVLHPKRDETK